MEIDIITGCTGRTPTKQGQRQPLIRVSMDDLAVMTESVPGCQWILKGLQKVMELAWTSFKLMLLK